MREFIRVTKALSDPNRVRILKLLRQKELCVCELQALFSLSQPTISKHLRVLEEAELVGSRKQGSWTIYRLAAPNPSTHAGSMLAYLENTELEDLDLHGMLLMLPQIDRERLAAA